MDENIELSILIGEIKLLMESLETRGIEFDSNVPHGDALKTLAITDLRRLKRDFERMIRTLGGDRS